MMRFVSRFAIVPGSEAEYRRRHDAIWPEMLALLREAGLKNYSIWRRDDELVEYFETDDIAAARRVLAESDVKKRWDAYMQDILILDEHGQMLPMELEFAYN